MARWYPLIIGLALLMLASTTGAQDVDEDDIFGDAESVVDIEETLDDSITEDIEGESVTFSGDIAANAGFALTRDYLDDEEDFEENPYSTSIEGDFLLDLRWREGIKAFADLWASYSPQDSGEVEEDDDHLDTTLKEFFVDVNIARKVYFRGGKQNLKWGRGYFWNPTDLISEDRKDFLDLDARREGVYGLKTHIPFGTAWNLYGFINASGANQIDEFSFAAKVETLLPKDIEVAVSAWGKEGYRAVFGLDFATYQFRTQWRGELSLSHGDNRDHLEVATLANGEYEFSESHFTDEWVPRLCIGFTKTFDYRDVNDRINLTGEFYYNHAGYDDDMLDDADIRDTMLEGGYFEPGNYGKYYAAIFSSYSKFLVSDMSLHLDAIGNLSDPSFIISSGISYELTNNAYLIVELNGYPGKRNQEYTLMGNALSAEASINLSF